MLTPSIIPIMTNIPDNITLSLIHPNFQFVSNFRKKVQSHVVTIIYAELAQTPRKPLVRCSKMFSSNFIKTLFTKIYSAVKWETGMWVKVKGTS